MSVNATVGAMLSQLAGSIALATPVHAQRRTPADTGAYELRRFTTDDGLGSELVSAFATTSDGFLWVAGGGLVSRFDGQEFRTYTRRDAPSLTRRVSVLHVGLADTVWALDEGGAIFSLADGRIQPVVPVSGLAARAVAQAPDGSFFLLDTLRLYRIIDRARGPVPVRPTVRVRSDDHMPVLRDRAGTIWLVDAEHHLRAVRLQRDGAMTVTDAGSVNSPQLVLDPRTGDVLFTRASGAQRAVISTRGDTLLVLPNAGRSELIASDLEGYLWFADKRGYAVYAPGRGEPTARIDPPLFDSLAVVSPARGGCVWLGELAVRRACRRPFRTITRSIKFDDLLSVDSDSTTFVWNDAGRVFRLYANGALEPVGPADDRLLRARTYRAPSGRVWWSPGEYAPSSVRATYPQLSWLPHHNAELITPDPRDASTVWYRARRAVYRLSLSATGAARVLDSLVVGGQPTALAVSSRGVLWVAVQTADGHEVVRADSTGIRRFGTSNGLPDASLRVLHVDARDRLWVGTYGAGVAIWQDGRFQRLTTADGLAEDIVTSLLDDGLGNIWMGGNLSVHRVPIAEVDAWLADRTRAVHGVAYTREDGLRTPETSGRTGQRTGDGRLWFPTIGGVAIVSPRDALSLDDEAPRVHLLAVFADTLDIPIPRPRTGSDTAEITLPLGVRRLSVRYAGLAPRHAETLRYSYQLNGLDADWIPVGTAREISFSGLRPGRQLLRVRAEGRGERGAAEATLAIVVPRRFTESAWFLLVLTTAGAFAVVLIVRTRERVLRSRATALQLAVDERTERLGQALQQVADQADELRRLDQTKSRMFANVSHEFRTPLSLVIGPIEDLRAGTHGELPPAGQRSLDIVARNASRLSELVEQLLVVARLEADAVPVALVVTDVVPLLRRIVDALADLAERRRITLSLTTPAGGVVIPHDPELLEKIIVNLIGNALKFTPSGGKVDVSASLDADDDAGARLTVTDTGPGIDPAHHEQIFARFVQLDDASNRQYAGTGIGLALVKELAELQGGTVSVRSTLGSGATFTVRLPRGPFARIEAPLVEEGSAVAGEKVPGAASTAKDGAAPPTPANEPPPDQATILLVEDHDELREFLRERLATRFRVVAAEDGSAGLRVLRDELPDVVVSDVMMPGMDGHQLLTAIRADASLAHLPVILLTARASRASKIEGLHDGADDYLTKPVDIEELTLRVGNIIAARRRVRERFASTDRMLPAVQAGALQRTIVVAAAQPPMARTDAPTAHDAGQRLLARFAEVLVAELDNEDCSADTLARGLAMSRSSMYRRLEPLLGQSPMEALLAYRLEQAAQWLVETDLSVSEIAYGVGFKSVPHFGARFRARFGTSPAQYRSLTPAPAAAPRATAGPPDSASATSA